MGNGKVQGCSWTRPPPPLTGDNRLDGGKITFFTVAARHNAPLARPYPALDGCLFATTASYLSILLALASCNYTNNSVHSCPALIISFAVLQSGAYSNCMQRRRGNTIQQVHRLAGDQDCSSSREMGRRCESTAIGRVHYKNAMVGRYEKMCRRGMDSLQVGGLESSGGCHLRGLNVCPQSSPSYFCSCGSAIRAANMGGFYDPSLYPHRAH